MTLMKARCNLSRMRNGTWLVRHSSTALSTVAVSGSSREEALTKMRVRMDYFNRNERYFEVTRSDGQVEQKQREITWNLDEVCILMTKVPIN